MFSIPRWAQYNKQRLRRCFIPPWIHSAAGVPANALNSTHGLCSANYPTLRCSGDNNQPEDSDELACMKRFSHPVPPSSVALTFAFVCDLSSLFFSFFYTL